MKQIIAFAIVLIMSTTNVCADNKKVLLKTYEGNMLECYVYYGVVYYPTKIDAKKQLISLDMLKKELDKIPEVLKENVSKIILKDTNSRHKKASNGYTILATCGGGTICFYRNDEYKNSINKILGKILFHEYSHAYDNAKLISSTKEWTSIVKKDKVKLYSGKNTSYMEEFAESVALYYCDNSKLKKRCRDRHKFIQNLLEP